MRKWGVFVVILLLWGSSAKGLDLKALQDSLHKLGNPWVAGETEVSHLPIEEKRKICGLLEIVPRPEYIRLPKRRTKMDLPATWDWRDKDGKNWMTSVKQNGYGDCWAFGWVGAQEAVMKIADGDPTKNPDLSEQFVVSCNPYGYGYGGFIDIGDWVKVNGIPDEACFPYAASKPPCTQAGGLCIDWEVRAEPGKITDWGMFPLSPNADAVKEQLMSGGPMACGMTAKEDFFYYKSGVYEPIMGEKMGNHSVCVCGWRADGKWIFKNCWDIDWGINGYSYTSVIEYPTWMEMEPLAKPRIVTKNADFNEPNDNVWDPGETVTITVTLVNSGLDATSVTGVLSTTNSNVDNITDETFNFGPILKNGTANNSGTPFKVTAKPGASSGTEVKFNLHVTASGGYSQDIEVKGYLGWKESFDPPGGTFVYGMAFDGEYLWVTDFQLTTIKKVNAAMGTEAYDIPTPNNLDECTGITWDWVEKVLWVHNRSTKKIYKVHPGIGSVLDSFPSPANVYPTGLAFDGEYLWAVDMESVEKNEYTIYELDKTGFVMSSFSIPITPQVKYGPRGLAFEPTGPGGGSLILLMSHFNASNEYEKTVIYEIKRDGSLVSTHSVQTPGSNGRAVEVHPNTGKYWVSSREPAKIYRIDGFYEVGTEEILQERRNLSFVTLPNPARDKTSVSFCVPNVGRVSLNIYDIAGKLVYCLVDNEMFQPGSHTVTWNGNDHSGKEVPYGIYFLRLKSNKSTCVKKVILLK